MNCCTINESGNNIMLTKDNKDNFVFGNYWKRPNNAQEKMKKRAAFNGKDEDGDGEGGSGGEGALKKTKVDSEKLLEISRRCDSSLTLISDISEQIKKIIEYKRRTHDAASGAKDELYRRQVVEYMFALENLTKIDASLELAAKGVKDLCTEANKLLGFAKGPAATRTIGSSLGRGGAVTDGNFEGDDDEG